MRNVDNHNNTTATSNNKRMLRMKRIEGRLGKEGLDAELRAKLEARLALLKERAAQPGPNVLGLTKRLARLDAKLATETDPGRRGALETRRLRVARRLGRPVPAPHARAGLARRLAETERRLAANEAQRAKLEQSKARLEAQLSALAGEVKVTAEKVAAPVAEESSGAAAAMFPRLNHRLARVSAKLANTTDPASRGVLQDRKDRLQQRLDRKIQKNQQAGCDKKHPAPQLAARLGRVLAKLKTVEDEGERRRLEEQKIFLEMKIERKIRHKNRIQKNQQAGCHKKHHAPQLTARLGRVLANLKTVEDEGQRRKLEERKAFLEMKIERKIQHKNRKGRAAENVALRARELLSPDAQQLEGVIPESGDRALQEADVVLAPTAAMIMHPRRARQKQRLIGMEAKARGKDNSKALDRIALQQVYVAYYPDGTEYVPLFDPGEDLLHQRAALRQQALAAAANRAVPGADWVAEDMYGRLPEKWSLEDELATFGGCNRRTTADEAATIEGIPPDAVAAGEVGDGFVHVSGVEPPPAPATAVSSWVQVDDEGELKGNADTKKPET